MFQLTMRGGSWIESAFPQRMCETHEYKHKTHENTICSVEITEIWSNTTAFPATRALWVSFLPGLSDGDEITCPLWSWEAFCHIFPSASENIRNRSVCAPPKHAQGKSDGTEFGKRLNDVLGLCNSSQPLTVFQIHSSCSTFLFGFKMLEQGFGGRIDLAEVCCGIVLCSKLCTDQRWTYLLRRK